MTNREVARLFNLLAKLKELHGENPFRTRAYSSAYIAIRKCAFDVLSSDAKELIQIDGVGKTIVDKILELKETGQIGALEAYLKKTPPGVVDMLGIKGFGPKKVRTVWQEMHIESPGELLYACHENRLVELKGFGQKTQQSLIEQITYFLDSKGKYLYGHVEEQATELLSLLSEALSPEKLAFTGQFRRKMPVLDGIELLTTAKPAAVTSALSGVEDAGQKDGEWFYREVRVIFQHSGQKEWGRSCFEQGGSAEFLDAFQDEFGHQEHIEEDRYFTSNGLAFIPSEAREGTAVIRLAQLSQLDQLVDQDDIKGVVHAHSTYSDGTNTLAEMAGMSKELGYEYLVISDHSKAAFYANGLTEDRVLEQIDEVDRLNAADPGFRIFKSIECDILSDGQLDYDTDFLSHFELVIASVHSNLKMDSDKANHRLLQAIENPHTRILGHPTGRLLLSRPGYPIDHKLIIDACAENGVAIEINANPYRLDLDWTWIAYAMERDVLLSVNPDAHSIRGIKDIRYGVYAARKGGLLRSHCLNARSCAQFEAWINNS